jgi:nucleoside 2-deoxyribosyltransferase
MKIYFAGSIRGRRDDAALYRQIIAMLMEYGEVLTEHVGDASLTRAGEYGPSDEAIYGRDMAWLTEADAVVAEVTVPSHGVGYEVAWAAEALGKPGGSVRDRYQRLFRWSLSTPVPSLAPHQACEYLRQ